MEQATTFTKVQAGVYESSNGYVIFRDDYTPVYNNQAEAGRKQVSHFDHTYEGATEVCWIVATVEKPDDNKTVTDTLREAKAWVNRR